MTGGSTQAGVGLTGAELIGLERSRHEQLGHDATHDVRHANSELAAAAICYIAAVDMPTLDPTGELVVNLWPWGNEALEKVDPVRALVVAGSLIAAEIDRRRATQAVSVVDGS